MKKFIRLLDYWNFYKGEQSILNGLRRIYSNPGMQIVLLFSLINDLGNKGITCFILRRIYSSLKIKYGIDLPLTTKIGKRLRIFHFGNIFINPNAVIGDDVIVMQGVTIGNSMISDPCPIISDRCFLGAGSKVIGDVFLASDIRVGANAVVVRSCHNPGVTLVGVPAKEIKN